MAGIDEKDKGILRTLRKEGRITLTELGKRVNLSPASVKSRLEKLKKLGAIRGYSAVIEPAFLDEFVTALIFLTFEQFDDRLRPGLRMVANLENVEFLYIKSGESQVMLKAVFRDTDELRTFIERIKAIFGKNLKFVETNLIEEELKNCWQANEEASRR
jgi:Lrp/AsnC family leucine-responsive transcriptional regulator